MVVWPWVPEEFLNSAGQVGLVLLSVKEHQDGERERERKG